MPSEPPTAVCSSSSRGFAPPSERTNRPCKDRRLSKLLQLAIAISHISVDILKEISDYNHVVVMLSPQSMSVERFFDRSDPEKQFLLNVIESCEDSETVMENYRQGLALINSQKHYDEYVNSGFFTVVRQDTQEDTREEVCNIIAKHFSLI